MRRSRIHPALTEGEGGGRRCGVEPLGETLTGTHPRRSPNRSRLPLATRLPATASRRPKPSRAGALRVWSRWVARPFLDFRSGGGSPG